MLEGSRIPINSQVLPIVCLANPKDGPVVRLGPAGVIVEGELQFAALGRIGVAV